VKRRAWFLLLPLLIPCAAPAQKGNDAVTQAIAQGDVYESRHKYELALDAYHKADKLAHHNSAICFLKLAAVERKLGDFSSALDDAKKAVKAGGADKTTVIDAHLVRARLLVQMAGKPTDKKLREAEEEIRAALALDASQPLAQFDLGVVLLKQNRDAEGIPELKKYLAMPGTDPKLAEYAQRCIANPIRAREPFAPDFSFTADNHQAVSNGSLRGKVVLLDFWGTWCPPCRESVPILRDVQKKYTHKDFQLVSVSSDDDEQVWRNYVQAQHMDWTEYIDLSGEVQQAFEIESFPTYIVLDKDGVIRFRQSGLSQTTEMDLEDVINKFLKRPSNPALASVVTASAPASPEPAAAASPAPPVSSAAKNANGYESRSAGAAHPELTGVEASTISGNVYSNEELGITYEFPQGWIAADPAALHDLNERTQSAAEAAILQQNPGAGANLRIMMPKIVFYASQRGEGDGQRFSFPSIRFLATPAQVETLELETFRQMISSMATATGAEVIGSASEFQVKGHSFLRADLVRSMAGSKIYHSYVQTLAGDYLVTIEIYSLSQDEMQKIASSLQSMTVKDEDAQ
jgi:thiol-disulfide isomerase/thioredoxin